MGIYKPEIGDTVRFWNEKDELWETGDVIAYGADRRLFFIRPNDEDLSECLVEYTDIRPVSEQKTTGRMSALEFELDYWKNRAEVTHLQHVADNKRADDAEDELDEMRRDWAAAEARVEELEDQNRILKADRDQLKIERDEAWRAKSHAETGEQFAKADLAELKRYVDSQQSNRYPQDNQVPQAVRDNDDDWWELNHDTGMYECGRYSYALTDIATVFGIKERIY